VTRPSERGRTGVLAVVAALVVLGFVLGVMPSSGTAPRRSSFQRGEEGRLLAYLLLDDLGLRPRAWRAPPGDLPRARTLLWLPDAPPEPPEYLRELWRSADEAPDDERAARRSTGRRRDPRHYRRFLEEGGVMLVALDDDRRDFLVEELDLAAVARLELVRADAGRSAERGAAGGAQRVAVLGGEVLALDRGPRGRSAGQAPIEWIVDPERRATPLVADPDRPERAVAWSLPVGRGELVVVTDDSLFGNQAIRRGDNALYLVRLLEALGPIDAVAFDEHALGEVTTSSPLDLAFARGNLALTLHLAAALGILVWTFVTVRAFPRDPQAFDAASPAARARALGATLARLGRHDLLADWLRRGVLARLPGGRRDPAGTARERARAAVAAVAHAARDEGERARWERTLAGAAVDGAAELDAYARELEPLERLASRGVPRHNPRPTRDTR
jgi:hypothetical protein